MEPWNKLTKLGESFIFKKKKRKLSPSTEGATFDFGEQTKSAPK